jgi:hypothetical protein
MVFFPGVLPGGTTLSEGSTSMTTPTTTPKKFARNAEPELEEAIRTRAYELYEQRGREDGRAEEDWLRAEALIRSGRSKSVAA